MVVINDPNFSFSSWWKKVFIALVLSLKPLASFSGRLSPHNFEMCSISPLQACSFRYWFPNNSVITFLEGCFPSSFVAEVVIFFYILYSKDLSSGGIVMLLSSLIFSVCEDRVLFVLIHFQPECHALFSSSSHSVKFCPPSQPECCLKYFLPLVPFFH